MSSETLRSWPYRRSHSDLRIPQASPEASFSHSTGKYANEAGAAGGGEIRILAMTKPNDGGSAFPETFSTFSLEERKLTDVYSAGGMTLRAWYAGLAMQGAISNPYAAKDLKCAEDVAEYSLKAADALIAALNKP